MSEHEDIHMTDDRISKMTIERLSDAYGRECSSDSPAYVQDNFYELCRQLIFDTQQQFIEATNPNERDMLRDMVSSIIMTYNGIVTRRLTKTITMAELKAAGTPVPEDRLTPDEKAMMNEVATIKKTLTEKLLKDCEYK